MKQIEFKPAFWLPVVSAALTLILGIILSVVRVEIGWVPLIAATAICLGIFWLAMHAISLSIYPTSIALLNDLKSHIDQYTAKDSVNWIISSKRMAQLEESDAQNEVWLVTSDLSEDIPGALFFNVVHKNLKKGVRYVYFIPRSLQAATLPPSLGRC